MILCIREVPFDIIVGDHNECGLRGATAQSGHKGQLPLQVVLSVSSVRMRNIRGVYVMLLNL